LFVFGCFTGTVLGVALAVGGAVAAVYLFKDPIIRLASKQLQPPPILIDARADYNWEVKTVTGTVFDMRALEGGPVFLHLWSGDCYACLTELEAISRLHEQFAEQGVVFACIARGGFDDVPRIIAEYDLKAPVYLHDGTRPAPFDDDAVPVTYIIARDGRIAFKHLGSARWDAPVVADLLARLTAE